jgi:nicotinate phosphoribosyltransferase
MATHIPILYRQQTALLADLYHLTMAYGFWHQERSEQRACFHLFFRKPPYDQPFVIAAGLELAMDLVEQLTFTPDHIRYLGQLKGADGKPLFPIAFLNYLQRLTFSCDIDAVPEGTVVFPHQPLLRVTGPLVQATILESALINVLNFSTLIATKSQRIVAAADSDPVLEFGLRRAQGLDGALTASRAAYIGGCHATSHLLAGHHYQIPVKGTHAHSWVMCFDSEEEAFAAYAEALPNNCIFLVDTYDTLAGVEKAITIGRRLRDQGHELNGIRLDSGDMIELSKKARVMLDEAGFPDAAIVGSDGLDEYKIRAFKKAGSPINVWGVGTNLVTGQEQTALGGVYKLGAIREKDGTWQGAIKLSEEAIKTSNPGVLDIRRFYHEDGRPFADMIYDTLGNTQNEWVSHDGIDRMDLQEKASKPLLQPIFREGKRLYSPPALPEVRAYARKQAAAFAPFLEKTYRAGLSRDLYDQKQEISRNMQART